MKQLLKTPETLVQEDTCPRCRGDPDTGWECTACGFDALYIAMAAPRKDADAPRREGR